MANPLPSYTGNSSHNLSGHILVNVTAKNLENNIKIKFKE